MDIFCKIINKEIPSTIIFEDENFLAFEDINPKRKGHFLVIPKKHSESLKDMDDKLVGQMFETANKWAKETIKKMKVSGFNIEVNTSKEAGQEVFHTHVHIIPTNK